MTPTMMVDSVWENVPDGMKGVGGRTTTGMQWMLVAVARPWP